VAKTKDKSIRDAVVLVGAAAADAKAPGAGLLIKLLDKMLDRFGASRRSRGARYVSGIADAFGWDPEMAASEMDERMDDPVFQETVEEGYWRILVTWHELARHCITALVADFLRRGVAPDRDYHLAASTLSVCDEPLLHALNTIACEYADLLDTEPPTPGRRVLAVSVNRQQQITNQIWMLAWPWETRGGRSDARQTETLGAERPVMLDAAARLLERNDLGECTREITASPAGQVDRGGRVVMEFTQEHDARMRALHGYLAPVRKAR
jgi:hypothetical protein